MRWADDAFFLTTIFRQFATRELRADLACLGGRLPGSVRISLYFAGLIRCRPLEKWQQFLAIAYAGLASRAGFDARPGAL